MSRASFGTVHRNDANAALRAWADMVIRESRLSLPVQVSVLETSADWQKALSGASVHALSSTTEEFLRSGEKAEHVFLTFKGAGFERKYVILTKRGAGLDDLAALRGRRLVENLGPKLSAARPWLELLLADGNLGRSDDFFEDVSGLENASKCVLKVFFGQAEACLVDSESFEVACELTPLVGQQLQVIALSPPLVPALLFFRNSLPSRERAILEATIVNLHTTKSGQQLLTVSQSTRMERHPVAVLDTTRQLLERYARLTGPTASAPSEPAQGESRITTDGGLSLGREALQIQPGISRIPSSATLPKP